MNNFVTPERRQQADQLLLIAVGLIVTVLVAGARILTQVSRTIAVAVQDHQRLREHKQVAHRRLNELAEHYRQAA